MSNPIGDSIRGIMSLPRVTWTATMDCHMQAAYELKYRARFVTGVFWGQCLEREIEYAIAEGKEKYALVIDYDSVFNAADITTLWEVMEENPDITALCPVQVKRESNDHLHRKVEEPKFNSRDAVEIESGHFGLTLIRLSHLKNIPRPLFKAVPDMSGNWGPYKTDEDIYFWHQLKKYGRNICMCPRVKIGHLQLLITWPDGKYSKYQYVNEFKASGRPGNCEVS